MSEFAHLDEGVRALAALSAEEQIQKLRFEPVALPRWGLRSSSAGSGAVGALAAENLAFSDVSR